MSKNQKHGYQPGKILLFREGEIYYLVKCVKNESDSEFERYSLEIVEVLRDPYDISKYFGVGKVFKVDNRVGSPSYVWHLRDPEKEEEFIARLRSKRDAENPKP